jgi:hypothetical protein
MEEAYGVIAAKMAQISHFSLLCMRPKTMH